MLFPTFYWSLIAWNRLSFLSFGKSHLKQHCIQEPYILSIFLQSAQSNQPSLHLIFRGFLFWAPASLACINCSCFIAGHRVFRSYSSNRIRSHTRSALLIDLRPHPLSRSLSLCFSGYPLHPLAQRESKVFGR